MNSGEAGVECGVGWGSIEVLCGTIRCKWLDLLGFACDHRVFLDERCMRRMGRFDVGLVCGAGWW